jgi:hypothetical protein
MSDENNSPPDTSTRPRRGSFTSNTFTALFGRSNSTSGTAPAVAPQPGPINTAPASAPNRRMSIAAIGLSGTSPIQTSNFGFPGGRRGSVSTAGSDSIDENAVDDDEGPSRSQPTTPFTRRMSFGAQALFNARGNSSPTSGRNPSHTTQSPLSRTNGEGGHGKKSPSNQASTKSQPRTKSDYSSTGSAEGLNWSEQFRSRAESAVQRPSFGPNTMPKTPTSPSHSRAKSFSDMPSPPTASIPAPAPAPQQSALRRKPDAVGERILRGDFYMD